MKFTLPELPFEKDALEPHISAKTIEFHYGKHHKTYVDKLNKLVEGTEFANADLETIIKNADGGIFNNGAQVWNHTFYFEALSGNPKAKPGGKLLGAIDKVFGNYEQFIEDFTNAGTTLFGSGWVWLIQNKDGDLDIMQGQNAENPIRDGYKPLMTMDVWEHAYYLDTQNARPKYIENFFAVLDWEVIEKRLG
ncbi:superoxide dismutase [Salinivirga cyanobacteriivorans]|uniref:Superoxide dismutase n=1 Tax=Salinivirga cyanobacteriivorans TaxID=1307839 RepID=A0A0S2I3Z7_9BACT|nr:superoxide dismutase [Salinivirga cyanobacteriivorans]ALO16907.1 Superoxide dismutase (Fe) [Salinivirga cyanobacteriivorans]